MGSEPQFEQRSELIDLPVLQEFKLYETESRFYLIGSDENKNFQRILKIDRTDRNELKLFEDPTRYTNEEMGKLKIRLNEGNRKAGGLKAVTTCYGIIGFVTFLEPYYMLVITKRKKVGEICGHSVYSIVESQMITIPHPSIQTSVANSKTEQRCKMLLSKVDLSKNFYFSYTYHLMYSLQKNVCNTERGNSHRTMFVWNVFLTQGITRILKNTIWTVALVYGFFQQTKCLVSSDEFVMTVIARRSRHYAGTRYLRRGINDIGSVANDVEIEQIVSKEVPKGQKIPIASVVQMRGSIPLFWSQNAPYILVPQPRIILDKKDKNYVTTQHHFTDLRQRYGDRILILNLLKKDDNNITKKEKKKDENNRESILGAEFAKAIRVINKRTTSEKPLKAIHFDLSKHSKSGADTVFMFAKKALELTNLFFCEAPSGVGAEGVLNESDPLRSQYEEETSPEAEALKADIFMLQNGVLRTNCIDCLDRTNMAQYVHGLVALAHQLHKLGITGPPAVIDIRNPLARNLMKAYENMGDIIALQYTGSKAHGKLFSYLRGDSNVFTEGRDNLISIGRYYHNAYLDNEKQNAINVFLGHFQPKFGDTYKQNFERIGSYLDKKNFERIGSYLNKKNLRPGLRRSLSDNLLMDSDSNLEDLVNDPPREGLKRGVSETILELPLYETEPASLSFPSAFSGEEHLRGPGSHSYQYKFISAEEIFNSCSPNESATSTTSSFELQRYGSAQHGLSKEFTQWIDSAGALYKV